MSSHKETSLPIKKNDVYFRRSTHRTKLSLLIVSIGHLFGQILFFFQFFISLYGVFPAHQYLPAVYPASGEEINACLYPQSFVFKGDFA